MSFLDSLSPTARRRWRAAGSLALVGYCLTFLRAANCDGAVAAPGAAVADVAILGGDPLALEVGGSKSLSASILDGTNAQIQDRDVAWTTSNAAVATIERTAQRTATVRGKAAGTARIIAAVDGIADTLTVNVGTVSQPVARLLFLSNPPTIRVADSTDIFVSALDASNNGIEGIAFTWTLSDPSIVAMRDLGGGRMAVFGLKEGTTTVTAQGAGKSASLLVTVKGQPAPKTIRASVDTVKVTEGGQASVTLTAYDRNGAALPDSSFGVSIASTSVARFTTATGTASGRTPLGVTGVTAGNATITATIGANSFTFPVKVSPVAVDSVVVTPGAAATLALNATTTLAAKVYGGGKELTGRTIAWSSTNATAVEVAANGATATLTAKAAGTSQVIAASGGKADTVSVTVTTAPTQAATISAVGVFSTKRLANGQTQSFDHLWIAGDHEENGDKTFQAFSSYLFTALPAGAAVTKAELKLAVDPDLTTGSPFALGTLMIEPADGSVLNEGPLQGNAIPAMTATSPTTLTVDVTAIVKAAVAAGKPSVLFRFRFTQLQNNNGKTDYLGFAATPLVVTYTGGTAGSVAR